MKRNTTCMHLLVPLLVLWFAIPSQYASAYWKNCDVVEGDVYFEGMWHSMSDLKAHPESNLYKKISSNAAGCGSNFFERGKTAFQAAFEAAGGTYTPGEGPESGFVKINNRFRSPTLITEAIMNPVPKISTSLQPNQYFFQSYMFPQITDLQTSNAHPVIPVSDPLTITHLDPTLNPTLMDTSLPGAKVDVNTNDDTVNAVVGVSSLASIVWPPQSIYDNITTWNQPLATTFKAFVSGTPVADSIYSVTESFGHVINSANASAPKWYPLNFFTVADPSLKIPSLPTVPVSISWAPVAGASKYKFMLGSTNPIGLPDVTPLPPVIELQIANPQTYSFVARPSATYCWTAAPLVTVNGADSPLLGDPIVSKTLHPVIPGNPGEMYNPFPPHDAFNSLNPFNPLHLLASANPFWSGVSTVTNKQFGRVAGQRNFLSQADTEGGAPDYVALPYIQWDKIPGAARYELQYSIGLTPGATNYAPSPIPDSLDFDTSPVGVTYTAADGYNAQIPHTAFVLGAGGCSNCGLNEGDDLFPQLQGFQYAFGNIPGGPPGGNGGGVYWRIRGMDAAGNVIRKNIIQSGCFKVPLPEVPYQSGYPVWSRVAGATGYVVDVVENVADFVKFPLLSPAEVPLQNANYLEAKVAVGSAQTTNTTTQTTHTTQTTGTVSADNLFLLRRVVPDASYTVGKVTVDKFIGLLKGAKVSIVEQSESSGNYDDLSAGDPLTDWRAIDEDELVTFNGSTPSDSQAYTDALNYYYKPVVSDMGMNIYSPTSNTIRLITVTPINIINKSTGNAKLTIVKTVTQNPYRMITTLVFGVNGNTSTAGYYSFDMVKLPFAGVGGTINAPGVPAVVHPLTYSTFGPMPVLVNLTGKDYTEFTRLLPGTTYYYRVRGFKDPNPLLPNSGSNSFIWYPWSTVASFSTPTGIPVSLSIGGGSVAGPAIVTGRGIRENNSGSTLQGEVPKQ